MIDHHEGAVTMVENLLEQPGSAYDPVLFEFTSDVTNEQEAEIERMSALLVELSSDPRSNLAAGLGDAGEAIRNITLLASLPKPAGSFDSDNPAGLPPPPPDYPEEEATTQDEEEVAETGRDQHNAKERA